MQFDDQVITGQIKIKDERNKSNYIIAPLPYVKAGVML